MTEHRVGRGRKAVAAVVQSVFILSLLWTALFLSWQSLSAVNFFYPLWYESLDIREHIAHYGPMNRFRNDFEDTSDRERIALFAAIVDAVNDGGEGLDAIRYRDRSGANIPFLREAERIHLRSVASLIDSLRAFSYVVLGLFLLSVGLMRRGGIPLPRPRRVLASAAVGVVAVGLAVMAMGPERVFYALHTWIFPAGEQWYFYYEESLMSTLMKAPDLFGAIAVALLVVALFWFALLLLALRRLGCETRKVEPG